MTLLPELWFEVLDRCTPLSLFFLQNTCMDFRHHLTQTFSLAKAHFSVPDATSYEELVYFLSLRRGEQVKYCTRHDWAKTFALLPRADRRSMYQDLTSIPVCYKMLYPQSRVQSMARRSGDVYFTPREEVEFLLTMTDENYRKFQLDISHQNYYKLPLAIQREQLDGNFADEMENEVVLYWVFTGELVGQRPTDLDKSDWQSYRDFVASEGRNRVSK